MTAERYGITNVPVRVWVDEDDRIVKPPTIAPGDDQFREYTQIDSAVHHDALRAWVASGELPASADRPAQPRTDAGQRALGERRIAAHLVRRGEHRPCAGTPRGPRRTWRPWDWTVRRGGIAMTGGDPFLERGVPGLLAGVGRRRAAGVRGHVSPHRVEVVTDTANLVIVANRLPVDRVTPPDGSPSGAARPAGWSPRSSR